MARWFAQPVRVNTRTPVRCLPCRETTERRGRKYLKSKIQKGDPPHWGGGTFIRRLPSDVLLAGIGHPNHVFENVDGKLTLKAGSGALWAYRSTDGGRTWEKPALIHDWASEGGVDVTASGKLIAALRYQRTTMPGDPPTWKNKPEVSCPGGLTNMSSWPTQSTTDGRGKTSVS